MSKARPFNMGLDRYSGLYLWALIIIVFALWTPDTFLSLTTVKSIATDRAVPAMVAFAVLIPLAAGAYDLSVGATINLSTILVTVLISEHGWGIWTAILFTIAVSVVIGLVNGFLVVKLRLSSFIATLGMATILTAIQSIVSGQSQPLPPTAKAWRNLAQYQIFGFQILVFYMIILAVLLWWMLEHTPVGRYLYAVGGNPEAARLSGVRTGFWTWTALTISSSICGVAGVIYASRVGPSLTFGNALLLPAFAAAFLGSTQIKPGRFNILGSLIAVFVLATGIKGLQLVTGVQWLNDMFNGLALIVAVSFATWRQRSKSKAAVAHDDGPVVSAPVEVGDALADRTAATKQG